MATNTAIGRLDELQIGTEDIDCYIERMEQYFIVNDIPDSKKVAAFLSAMGAKAYELVRNLVAPEAPKDKRFNDLVKILRAHLKPKPLVIAERFKFHKRTQLQEESVAEYIVTLKGLSTHCEFGTFLNDALRDQFVCGLRQESIQKRLLAEDKLTFKKASEIAQAMELAERNTIELKAAEETEVQAVSDNPKVHTKQKQGASNRPLVGETNKSCYRCGGHHRAEACRFRTAKCHKCGKIGHLAKKCRSREGMHQIEEPDDVLNLNGIYAVTKSNKAEYTVDIEIEGHKVNMQLDTGAAVSIIPETLYNKILTKRHLTRTRPLRSYSGDKLDLLGESQVSVKYGAQTMTLPLVVVKGSKVPLLGRNWLEHIKLNWSEVFTVQETDPVKRLTDKYSKLFDENNGKIINMKAHITLQEQAKPVYRKARPVPYALKKPLETKLDSLEQQGILEKVEHSSWATPVVLVPKPDKTIRLCGDYKVTINPWVKQEGYPLPTVQDLFSTLAGGKLFTKLDLKQAYQQLQVDEGSQEYLTINTHKGLYRYTRLPFGVSSAPSIFQATMDQILQGVNNTICYLDDILVTGKNETEHIETLEEVLQRLQHHGVKIRLDKCQFLQKSVEYLGHRIDASGLHPTEAKVKAIVDAPTPKNLSELKSYLGLLNYYGRFLPNLSSMIQPLNQLQSKGQKWEWSQACQQAFEKSKQALVDSPALAHYDATKPLQLACDASPYGVGAVLSQHDKNGNERPVAFASRTLSSAEKNYAQIEREALSLIFGVRKFHQYLYGRVFTLFTDHKPLTSILNPKAGIPTLAAARMQRWALILAGYQYNIVYRKAEENANADAMSRLPANPSESDTENEDGIFQTTYLDELPIWSEDIERETRHDTLLSKVLQFTSQGWPNKINHLPEAEDLKPYYTRKDQLTVEKGCILWGVRVVIPEKFRERLLNQIHEEHPGICKMKSLARCYLWWPTLDKEIEAKVKSCGICAAVRNMPPTAPLHTWEWPTRIWQRLHIDFAQKGNHTFLVVIDSHSKWLEVFNLNSTTAEKTCEILRTLFASYGLPEEIVTDNGPQFISSAFKSFLKRNGVRHTLVPPYHPASNGAAERSVQILKRNLEKQVLQKGAFLPMAHRLANFLYAYRNTPHTVTGVTPASLFLKRSPRTKLSLIHPNLAETIEHQQRQQKKSHDSPNAKRREFNTGDRVQVKEFNSKNVKWNDGIIENRLGSLTYQVNVQGKTKKIHVDHLLPSYP